MTASDFLTTTSTLRCPHGGKVTASTSNSRVYANGQPILRSTDGFLIGGCNHKIGTIDHPCVRVEWDVKAERHDSHKEPSLIRASIGYCIAADEARQGVVEIASTQNRAAGT